MPRLAAARTLTSIALFSMTATTTVPDEAGSSSSSQSAERTAGVMLVLKLGAPADEEVTI